MSACDLCSVISFSVCVLLYQTGHSEKSWAAERDGARKQRHMSDEVWVMQSSACVAIALLTTRICRILAAVVLRPYDFVLRLNQLLYSTS
jgi:hypothetical protein